jgi:hypothetical protein
MKKENVVSDQRIIYNGLEQSLSRNGGLKKVRSQLNY